MRTLISGHACNTKCQQFIGRHADIGSVPETIDASGTLSWTLRHKGGHRTPFIAILINEDPNAAMEHCDVSRQSVFLLKSIVLSMENVFLAIYVPINISGVSIQGCFNPSHCRCLCIE